MKRMTDEEFERYAYHGTESDPSVAFLCAEARRARDSEAELLEALTAVAFELRPGTQRLICRRCREDAEQHSPERCEVARAITKAEGSR